jgi:hypothetical protein
MVYKALTLTLVAKLVDVCLVRTAQHETAAASTEPMLPRLPMRMSLEKALSKNLSRGKANLVKNPPQRWIHTSTRC